MQNVLYILQDNYKSKSLPLGARLFSSGKRRMEINFCSQLCKLFCPLNKGQSVRVTWKRSLACVLLRHHLQRQATVKKVHKNLGTRHIQREEWFNSLNQKLVSNDSCLVHLFTISLSLYIYIIQAHLFTISIYIEKNIIYIIYIYTYISVRVYT